MQQCNCPHEVMLIPIFIEKKNDGESYSAYAPTLVGCFSNGRTIEEVKRNILEAVKQHIQAVVARRSPSRKIEREFRFN